MMRGAHAMKKKVAKGARRTPATSKGDRLAVLVAEVRGLIQSARNAAASAVNLLQVLTNFEIGRRIVEHEQKGARRAGYGQEMLKELSDRLTEGQGGCRRQLIESGRMFAEGNPHTAQSSHGGAIHAQQPDRSSARRCHAD